MDLKLDPVPIASPMGIAARVPKGPKGPKIRFLGHLGPYVGSWRALELCKIAIGFIWTKFQAKPTISRSRLDPFFFFGIFGSCISRTWDQGMRQYLGPGYEAVPGTRV